MTGSSFSIERDQQALGVVRIARHHRAQPADVREQRLRALAVRLPAVDAAAAWHADRDRRGEVAGRAVAQPRRLGDDLVRRRVEVVGELDLDHRPQPVGRHADRGADDAAFGDRRVEHARLAVLGLQPFGAAEHAAEVADVLPVDDDVRRRAPSITSIAERSAWIIVIGTVLPCVLRSCGLVSGLRQHAQTSRCWRCGAGAPACPRRHPRTSSPAVGMWPSSSEP